MVRVKSLIPVFVLLISGANAAWAERVLLQEGDSRALLETSHLCGQSVVVTVESTLPQLFQDDAPRLQRLIDGVRALLAFECPTIHEIEVQGRLKGMGTILYRGVATVESGWWLEARESIRSEADEVAAGHMTDETPAPKSGFEIAGLDTGMTVEEAKEAVQREFDVEPTYAPDQRVMRFEVGGCPPGYDPEQAVGSPQPGWKCLQGLFSDGATPRLQRFKLIQVTQHRSAQDVMDLLEGRFGPADARWTEIRHSGGLWGGERAVGYLAWGEVIGTVPVEGSRPRPTYELEATVDRIQGFAMTILTRAERDVPPDQPAKSDLRL